MTSSKNLTALLLSAIFVQTSLSNEYNLQRLADDQRIEAHNRSLITNPTEAPGSVYLTMAANDGIAWIKDLEFSEGTIEVEVKGANRPGQSFVGLAFHGADNATFDAVYLRPFNFQNPDRKNNALQYVSMPDHNWSFLRSSHPGVYESSVDPAPAPEDWVTLKLFVKDDRLSVCINGADTPELEVVLLNDRLGGSLGLWVGNGSDGEFRNLAVTRL